MTEDNITKIPVRHKNPDTEQKMLEVVSTFSRDKCNHRWSLNKRIQYLIREGETEVECSVCETKLDPMFVLRLMAHEETLWKRNRDNYQAEMERLNKRQRTKCQNCGEMTAISRK